MSPAPSRTPGFRPRPSPNEAKVLAALEALGVSNGARLKTVADATRRAHHVPDTAPCQGSARYGIRCRRFNVAVVKDYDEQSKTTRGTALCHDHRGQRWAVEELEDWNVSDSTVLKHLMRLEVKGHVRHCTTDPHGAYRFWPADAAPPGVCPQAESYSST